MVVTATRWAWRWLLKSVKAPPTNSLSPAGGTEITRTALLARGTQSELSAPLLELSAAKRSRSWPLTCRKSPPMYTWPENTAIPHTWLSTLADQPLTTPVPAPTVAACTSATRWRVLPPICVNAPPTKIIDASCDVASARTVLFAPGFHGSSAPVLALNAASLLRG